MALSLNTQEPRGGQNQTGSSNLLTLKEDFLEKMIKEWGQGNADAVFPFLRFITA